MGDLRCLAGSSCCVTRSLRTARSKYITPTDGAPHIDFPSVPQAGCLLHGCQSPLNYSACLLWTAFSFAWQCGRQKVQRRDQPRWHASGGRWRRWRIRRSPQCVFPRHTKEIVSYPGGNREREGRVARCTVPQHGTVQSCACVPPGLAQVRDRPCVGDTVTWQSLTPASIVYITTFTARVALAAL
jgi:hypothetical protein